MRRISRRQLTERVLLGLLCAVGGTYGTASAMPTGAHDLQNITGIAQNGSVMDIVGKGNAVAKWKDFSIDKGETVNFKGMNNVLNLVDGNRFSTIRGAMNGKGVNVYLVNPSGVLFGAESSVNVGSLHVSTQNATDDLAKAFVKDGTIAPDTTKLGFGDVTMVGNISADTIKVEGNNISLANTKALDAKNVTFSTPKGGFINVLKGQDVSKLKVDNGTIRNDFEAIDSQGKLANLKNGGHYMMTKDVEVDSTWSGAKVDATEQYKPYYDNTIKTRNKISGLVLNGMGHSIIGMNRYGLFEENTKGYKVELANLILNGDTFTREYSHSSLPLMDTVDGLKADNIINNYKGFDGKSYGGLFGRIRNAKLTNIVNNADNVGKYSYTGNITWEAENTVFQNVINNGTGMASLAEYIHGGDIIHCENNGDMQQAGFVKYYRTSYEKNMDNPDSELQYRDSVLVGNENNGAIGNSKTRMGSGDVGGLIADIEGDKSNNSTLVIQGNTNNGNVYGIDYDGALIGSVNAFADPEYGKDNTFVFTNNVNNGNVYGHDSIGLIGILGSANILIKDCENHGNFYSFTPNFPYWGEMGGIIGKLIAMDSTKNIVIDNVANYGTLGGTEIDTEEKVFGNETGGIIGKIESYSDSPSKISINHARNFGKIKGGQAIGGIVGIAYVDGQRDLQITNSFNAGSIESYFNGEGCKNGGIIGNVYGTGKGKVILQNIYNTGAIKAEEDGGGFVGHIDRAGEGNGVDIINSFNAGNVTSEKNAGGFVGNLSSNSATITIHEPVPDTNKDGDNEKKETEDTTSTDIKSGDITDYLHINWPNPQEDVKAIDIIEKLPVASLSIKDAYNTGVVSSKDSSQTGGFIGLLFGGASIQNAYTKGDTTKSLIGAVKEGSQGLLENVYTDGTKTAYAKGSGTITGNATAVKDMKKAAPFSSFDIDTDGSRKDATWRMYEGYTAPMLSVFMNSVDISDPNKTVEYNGKMQFFPLDEVEAKNPDFAKRNFFTDYIDYAKNNPVYDKATGKPFETVSGTEVGTYPAALYSTQLGYNFHTAANDDTVTLTIEPRKTPAIPTVPAVPSTVHNPVKLTLTHQTGSYKDLDGKNHDLLNGKEAARLEPIDNKDIIETKN